MGNAAAKEFQEQRLDTNVTLHEGGKYALSSSLITREELTLTGKSIVEEGRGGYAFFKSDETPMIYARAHDLAGRKGYLQDGDRNTLCEIRIEHHFKTDTHRLYRTDPSFTGQEVDKMGDEVIKMYLFAKIEATRTASGSTAVYSVITGQGDTWKPLYQAERIVASSFMALVSTMDDNVPVPVAKLLPLRGPKLQLQVASGVDLAAVMLTGEATSPTGGSLAALPGASLI